MAECSRCGDFTDNPADGDYHYCDDCQAEFNRIRDRGVIVQQNRSQGNYNIYVSAQDERHRGGTEESQIDALARGVYLTDELGLDGLFEYERSGSQWILQEYLQEHPSIKSDVVDRLSRVPEKTEPGLLDRLRSML